MSAFRAALIDQSRSCAELGSPFTARLMALLAERLTPGTPVPDRLLTWPGDVTSRGQSVPLRLAGALHRLVLDGHPALSEVYPPHAPPDDALWAVIETAFADQATAILRFLDSPPQTNEVRRSAGLIPALHLLADRFRLPIHLMELGASAGLNMRADRFRLEAGGVSYGPRGARVVLRPAWEGPCPSPASPVIEARLGVDLRPIDPAAEAKRLLAYIWPDQADRLALTRAAIDTAAEYPATVEEGDAVAWLAGRLAAPRPRVVSVVYHTIAWQYLPAVARARGEALLAAAGARASAQAPLARFSMEADGGKGAALTLQIWPRGETIHLGRADFHGRWIQWRHSCRAPSLQTRRSTS